MNSEKVRDATWEDLPRIVEIYNASIPGRLATSDLEPVTVESRRDWFASHSPERYPWWVWEVEGRVLGWIGLRAFYGRPAYHATAETAIYIAPEAHGQGIARDLLSKMQKRVPELGLWTLLSFIFSHNEASVRLFSKAGFVKWGDFPEVAELDGVWRDLWILGWKTESPER